MPTAATVDPAAAYDDHVLVHCPGCDGRAVVRAHAGGLRLTCDNCGHSATDAPSRRHFERGPDASLEAYNEQRLPFGARLWLEAECCGGNRIWALNERHLNYIDHFVQSKNRDREFPSLQGRRQLADKFPAWLTSAKHRDDVARAIQRLRSDAVAPGVSGQHSRNRWHSLFG
jgi:hypothetical protein